MILFFSCDKNKESVFMNIQSKKREEKVRDIDFTNPAINRIIHYSNLLNDSSDFFRDNGVTDFSQINSANGFQIIDPLNNEVFL